MIRLLGIIAWQVYAEIVHTIHTFVHHELHCQGGAFARFKNHRTDGRGGRSASLHDFDVGIFRKSKRPVACIGELEGDLHRLV